MALSTELSPNEKAFSFVTIGALFGLACYGLVTFLRLVQRDYFTDEYKEIVRYLRTELRLLTTELEDYKLPFRPSRNPLVKGGLALTVSLINTLIVAAPWVANLAGLARPTSTAWLSLVRRSYRHRNHVNRSVTVD